MSPSHPVFLNEASSATLDQADHVFLALTPEMVERGQVGEVVDRLMMLSDDRVLVHRLSGCMSLEPQGFEGYDLAPATAPGVARFMCDITREWPYWLAFLDLAGESAWWVLEALVTADAADEVQASTGELVDGTPFLKNRVSHLLAAAHNLHVQHGVSTKVIEQITAGTQAAIGRANGPL